MKIYLVGGAVRDEILGVESNDKDYVVVGSTPEEMLGFGFKQVGKDFPVFLHPETKDEYALARTERKSGSKHTDFKMDWNSNITLEEDLMRRDLTINAIAKTADGDYVDPFNGISDIKDKILRHVSENFKDDPLRVLRVARFAARDPEFKVADETRDLMKGMVLNNELDHLTPERIWKEIEKALVSKAPENFIAVLDEIDALKIILPEIADMKGVPQRSDYHAEGDVFIHNQMVLQEAAKLTEGRAPEEKALICFGALLHDVGKTKTPYDLLYDDDGEELGFHHGHDKKELVTNMITTITDRLKIPNKFRVFAIDVASHHQQVHGIKDLSAKKVTKFLSTLAASQKAGKEGGEHYVDMLLLACKADAFGRLVMSTADNKIIPASRIYEQEDVVKKAYKGYSDIKDSLGTWMESYKVRYEKAPSGETIKDRVHQIRVSSVKKALKDSPRFK